MTDETPSPEAVDEAIFDYFCRYSAESTGALAATGLAGLRRLFPLASLEQLTHRAPRDDDPPAPTGRNAADCWNGAMWTVVKAISERLSSTQVPLTDEELLHLVSWGPTPGIELIGKIGLHEPDRAARLCEAVLAWAQSPPGPAERQTKLEPWDRAEVERLQAQLGERHGRPG